VGEEVTVGSYALDRRDNTAAVMLEVLPGLFLQVFGLGHIYQGRVGLGLFIMISYWMLLTVNLFLTIFLIGIVTTPLTWLFYMIAAPMNANDFRG
jgi:TM2 domain-containing membrane protein YozV